MRDLLILLACAACLALALLAALATAPPTRRRLIAWCAGCGRPLCEGDGLHAIGTQRWGKCCRDKFFAEARAIGDPPGSHTMQGAPVAEDRGRRAGG